MSYDEYLLKGTEECTFVDGSVMYEMSDTDYRDYVRHALFFVDHHGSLRLDSNSGQIIATNREQFDILSDELSRLRQDTEARTREPNPARAAELMPERRDRSE
jgi:hypothetical protein